LEFERIEQEKEAVAEQRRHYDAQIKRIEAESRERIQNAVSEGQRVAAEIREVARKEAQEMLARARVEIEIDRDKAQIQLRDEVVRLSMEIASKVVREELTPEKHRKLVDGFLAEVGEAR
jgi:F-type H+-transporting ATPase subunit b